MKENLLVGKTIYAAFITQDRMALRFETLDGMSILARCDADCCSHTWIEHIEGGGALIGGRVLAVEDIDMPDLGNLPGRECVAYYGCKITTECGTCVIDYRNESNGYYGGWLSWSGGDRGFYGGVYGQNKATEDWMPLSSMEV